MRRRHALIERAVPGVDAGTPRPDLKPLAVLRQAGDGPLDLGLRGWGYSGEDGATMAGQGTLVERPYTPGEQAAIEQGAAVLELSPEQALACLGDTTSDVYLNDGTYWQNVPRRVWRYQIGGYQVLKKWLSYREKDVLGREITKDEAREFTHIVRRIAALLLLEPKLDANYSTVKANSHVWNAVPAVES